MILSNCYDNQKICEKNADLLCKRSHFVISIARHFYCGWDVCCIYCSHVSYVWLIYQCSLYVDKIKIFLKKISGCSLYTGVLNSSKITVIEMSNKYNLHWLH